MRCPPIPIPPMGSTPEAGDSFSRSAAASATSRERISSRSSRASLTDLLACSAAALAVKKRLTLCPASTKADHKRLQTPGPSPWPPTASLPQRSSSSSRSGIVGTLTPATTSADPAADSIASAMTIDAVILCDAASEATQSHAFGVMDRETLRERPGEPRRRPSWWPTVKLPNDGQISVHPNGSRVIAGVHR